MRLLRYRVTNFRSVEDSGWINVSDVSALIGVNESGKTNLLLPLWKLNPAQEGDIVPISDYPKAMFGTIRAKPEDYCFIEAVFNCANISAELSEITGFDAKYLSEIFITKHYDNIFRWEFPNLKIARTVSYENIENKLNGAIEEISALTPTVKEGAVKAKIIDALSSSVGEAQKIRFLSAGTISKLVNNIEMCIPENTPRASLIIPRTHKIIEELNEFKEAISYKHPRSIDGVWEKIYNDLPKFVYYSNYGNLDSEIYLPHVVENLKRTDLGNKEAAKARTLRVLFKFVKLSPEEILELGQEDILERKQGRKPTESEIETAAEKKRERSTLLQSASTMLTGRFKDWWRQGDYRFRFEADGSFFNIWVSDDRRPDEVELEGRSTGLQWFLSFYLVFLVESQEDHLDAVLLLDEPGMSLHPLAQRDLSVFFQGLSQNNQLIYTTHSPFLVDADHLDRVRKVYVDAGGKTKATEDLRQCVGEASSGAAYAVNSALNMSVAESLLIGCKPVIVEGPSDQHYLTAIKTLLISGGKLRPSRELVFPPSGGTKTIRSIASILLGRDEALPKVLLDADAMGNKMRTELQTSLYAECKDQVLSTGQFVEFESSEIEDLFPPEFIGENVDRFFPRVDEDFRECVKAGTPIVGQIEAWAKRNNIALEKGWKVGLSKRVKQQALNKGLSSFDGSVVARWIRLFEAISA